ncbi:nuclear transport factor 2 family protein [Aquisediminimonas sediminicola]|uniref:nuclear transport factor 2 family protein n=1 Tax=Alteraquisediminimonas sediminicola TaxID=2676787 RepID=UPI001C8D1219|nr:nuclear transport factor 2 family protein [Aquisediminimonas sediminicola]
MPLLSAPLSVQHLLDRAAIADLKYAYAYGVDQRDWALYRSIFTDRIEIDFFDWAGIRDVWDADQWVATVKETLAPFDATQHVFSNPLITLNGDSAICVTTMTARHVLGEEAQILGGYYTERMDRTEAGWKIAACSLKITWEEGDRDLFARAAALGPRPRRDVGAQGI